MVFRQTQARKLNKTVNEEIEGFWVDFDVTKTLVLLVVIMMQHLLINVKY